MKVTRLRIAAAFAAVYLIWGSTYLAIRFAIETLPPFSMAGLRFLIAGIALYVFARYVRRHPAPEPRHWKPALIIGFLLLLGGNGGVVWAEQYVPSGLASLFIATVPLWMVLLEWLWHRQARPGTGVFAGIALGFWGVWLLMAPGFSQNPHQPIHLGGTLALLTASLSWAVGSVYSRKAVLPDSPLVATGMEMTAGGACLLLLGLLQGEAAGWDPAAFSIKSVLAFLYLVVFGSLIGFTAYIWLLRAVGPARTSTYAFVNPVVAVLLGWGLGGEALTGRTILAALTIVAAVGVITFHQREEGGEVEKREE
ncbi:MAG: drug/metabolite exporter YedA [Candidatus Omnitrophota bacterium]|nr:drug/metabolite exporter YedA [Candidatus Omnitrophota bacterium]MDZ4241238.1 drug/metabolite exporter YedA [Candidatus Omnitrophota bacterium]